MPDLVLSDDDLALMRFTCDIFFCEESPLRHIESEAREPYDYGGAYNRLVGLNILDPVAFRVTDAALNRIAPVTECDGRLTHIVAKNGAEEASADYYLLDEIAVSYERIAADRHSLGPDLDLEQLIESLARRFVARRAGGDRLRLTLTPFEFLALSLLLKPTREQAVRRVSVEQANALLGKPPTEDGAPRRARNRLGIPVLKEPAWDDAVRSLAEKGALRIDAAELWVHGSLVDLCVAGVTERHTFVRTDFSDDDWLTREVTLFPAQGSLFFVGPRKGGIGIEDLDGDRLRDALRQAVGPLPRERPTGQSSRLTDILLRAEALRG